MNSRFCAAAFCVALPLLIDPPAIDNAGGQTFDAGRMLVFRAGDQMALSAGAQGSGLLLLGGAIMDGPRYIIWNFVSSSRERIE